jgi:hypothetical protein
VLSTIPLNISFYRSLVDNNPSLWHNLVGWIAYNRINISEDKFLWGCTKMVFFVKSMYLALISDSRVRPNSTIWRLKIPLKIKIFLWYFKWGVILTIDNLSRRNWRGGEQCVFCSQPESIQHLFFDCHFAQFIWTVGQIFFYIQKPLSALHFFKRLGK